MMEEVGGGRRISRGELQHIKREVKQCVLNEMRRFMTSFFRHMEEEEDEEMTDGEGADDGEDRNDAHE